MQELRFYGGVQFLGPGWFEEFFVMGIAGDEVGSLS